MAQLRNQRFYASLGKFAQTTEANLLALARQSIQELNEKVVATTPVDTGFLRGSWQPSIGQPGGGYGNGQKRSQISVTVNEAIALTNSLKLGDYFFMTNNAVYARRIEYGFVGKDSLGRNYNQAGRYWINDAVKAWPTIVSKVAKELA